MTDIDILSADAIIGDDAQRFMDSDLGRVVLGLAEQEGLEALENLKGTPPEDSNRIRELQNIIWRSESFKRWLSELITDGEQALRSIQHDEESQ